MGDNLRNLETKAGGWLRKLADNPYAIGVVALAIIAALLWVMLG